MRVIGLLDSARSINSGSEYTFPASVSNGAGKPDSVRLDGSTYPLSCVVAASRPGMISPSLVVCGRHGRSARSGAISTAEVAHPASIAPSTNNRIDSSARIVAHPVAVRAQRALYFSQARLDELAGRRQRINGVALCGVRIAQHERQQ